MPSHSGRGGGGFGGGPSGPVGPEGPRGRGQEDSNLLGSLIGGVIGGAIHASASERRRRAYGPPPPEGPYDRPPESRVYAKRSNRAGLYVFLIVVMIIFSIAAFSVVGIKSGVNADIKDETANITQIEKESEDFQLLLNGDSKVTNIGSVNVDITGIHYKNPFETYSANPKTPGFYHWEDKGDRSYYFMVYSLAECNGQIFTTYASFNDTDIEATSIVVKYGKLNGKWISINSDYSIEDNFEYDFRKEKLESMQESQKVLSIVSYILFAVVGLLFVVLVIAIVKGVKARKGEGVVEKAMDQAEYSRIQADIAESNSKINKANTEIKERNRYCSFCGSKIPEGKHKCPGCGASLDK